MAQPKSPPLSIRLPEDLLAAVDALAERRKIKRHAALIEALRAGLAGGGPRVPSVQETAKLLARLQAAELRTPLAKSKAPTIQEIVDVTVAAFGPQRAAPGSRLKKR